MRALTPFEAKFLYELKILFETDWAKNNNLQGACLSSESAVNPDLSIGIDFGCNTGLIFYKILIYGNRPVRYHLSCDCHRHLEIAKIMWNRLLGPLNLVEEKSGTKQDVAHLFYEVTWTENELKQLGER